MGGGCGADLMTVRNNQTSSRQLDEFSTQPFKDSMLFHKNLSNLDTKLADPGRSRMVSDLAVGSSQQENRINVFHENFMRKNNETHGGGVLATLHQQHQ